MTAPTTLLPLDSSSPEKTGVCTERAQLEVARDRIFKVLTFIMRLYRTKFFVVSHKNINSMNLKTNIGSRFS